MIDSINKLYETLAHSGSSVLQHLKGTASLLKQWGAPDYVVLAARYHTIYSTSTFGSDQKIPLFMRPEIEKDLGQSTERLVYLYAFKEAKWINSILAKGEDHLLAQPFLTMPLRCQLGFEIIDLKTMKAIVAIMVANSVEQAQRQALNEFDEIRWKQLTTFSKDLLPLLELELPLVQFNNVDICKYIPPLPAVFKWSFDQTVRELTNAFDEKTSSGFKKLLNTVDAHITPAISCNYVYDHMDEYTRMCCALSPKISSLYLHPDHWNEKEFLERVALWLRNEASLRNMIPFAASGEPATDEFYWDQTKSHLMENIKLFQLLPVDTGSSYYDLIWNQGDHTRGTKSYQSSDHQIIKDRLEHVFKLISHVDPKIVNFIIDNVRLISVRKDDIHTKGHGSSSWPHVPGLIGLINVDRSDIPIEKTVTAIIHETIHNYLYKIELDYPFSSDTKRFYGLKAKSSWTGRELPLASYLHACFVWFGVYFFWVKASNKIKTTADVAAELEKAKKGFGETYLNELFRLERFIRPDLFQSLLSLNSEVEATSKLEKYSYSVQN